MTAVIECALAKLTLRRHLKCLTDLLNAFDPAKTVWRSPLCVFNEPVSAQNP